MSEQLIPKPHGGVLVNRHGTANTAGLMSLEVSASLRQEAENIADGIFSPLEGFVSQGDFESIIKDGRLADGTPWTIPIVLDADVETAAKIKDAGTIALANGSDRFALMEIEDIFAFDKSEYARSVFQTNDSQHPGVTRVSLLKDRLVSGKIKLLTATAESPLKRYRSTPAQVREEIGKRGWKTMVGFQTRNVPHVAHEMLQKSALNLFDGLFLNPLIGPKKPGDFKDEVIISAYRALIDSYYPDSRVIFSTLHTEMRYAGPKEAIHHAIMRKNFGCSHFIVGRDHAGVGNYYHPFAAHKIFGTYPDLGVEPLFFPAFYYCKKCMAFANERNCPHSAEFQEELSGTKMRKMVSSGEVPAKHLMRPEVAQAILTFKEPFV